MSGHPRTLHPILPLTSGFSHSCGGQFHGLRLTVSPLKSTRASSPISSTSLRAQPALGLETQESAPLWTPSPVSTVGWEPTDQCPAPIPGEIISGGGRGGVVHTSQRPRRSQFSPRCQQLQSQYCLLTVPSCHLPAPSLLRSHPK